MTYRIWVERTAFDVTGLFWRNKWLDPGGEVAGWPTTRRAYDAAIDNGFTDFCIQDEATGEIVREHHDSRE